MPEENERTRVARAAAETALVRIVHHYGSLPEFVLIGGLMPDLLCTTTPARHAGTTDVDVQVDLEIAGGTENGKRLELALRNAEFEPDSPRVWRWCTDKEGIPAVVKFELLADLDDAPAEAIIKFDGCEALGAVNLRGTGFATRDVVVHELSARVGDDVRVARINTTGLAGFLFAKFAAVRVRGLQKDWYDIAFVLIHNDAGGPEAAAEKVLEVFGDELEGEISTPLKELFANFETPDSQGPRAYSSQMVIDHPESDPQTLAADAVVAVAAFRTSLFG